MNSLKRILSVCVASCTLTCVTAQGTREQPAREQSSRAFSRLGVWRSRGYGYILQIGQGSLKLFHAAGPFCYPDPRPEADPDGLFEHSQQLAEDVIAFSAGPGQTRYVFDRLGALPPACDEKAAWTADRIAALTAETFNAFYPSSRERNLDWRARAATAAGQLNERSKDDALFAALSQMLAGIEDPHVELHATVGGETRALSPGEGPTLRRVARSGDAKAREREWLQAYKSGILDDILRGAGRHVANKRVFWGRVDEIGYLNVVTMGSFDEGAPPDDTVALDAALDEALTAFSGARAVIVDVSNNRGGYDSISGHIAGRFAQERRLAYTKSPIGAEGAEAQAFFVEPSSRIRFLGPVYLLTSDVTVSAGETFTLLMRALPNVRHVGATTRGALSDQLEKPLPNGFRLALPAEVYRDPEGVTFEVKGIPPRTSFEVFPASDLTHGHARAVLRLMDDIRNHRTERP
uniref:Peptidase S41 n=1 Tax=Chondromyces catenulatus TaxID=1653841 RepID=A0A3S5GY18_9BACT|nr:peptidase S41 [Chondromyces catenulatus]